MINSITIDLRCFFERQPWGVVYHDYETDTVIDSDYCDDVDDCISSLYNHRDNFHFVCTADFILPDESFDRNDIIDEITAHFEELGISGWTCIVED